MKIPPWPKWPAAALLVITAAFPALAQNPETPKQASPKEQAEAMEATDLPEYPDSASGLEDLIKEMMRLEKSGDKKSLGVYAKSLELPNADAWFQSAFGDRFGPLMAQATSANREETAQGSVATIAAVRKNDLKDVHAVRFTDSCNDDATSYEYPILLLRQNQATLYDVRFGSGTRVKIWSFFAYVDGGFRYVSSAKRKEVDDIERQQTSEATKPLQVDTSELAKKLTHVSNPTFPPGESEKHTYGTVLLGVVVAKDGTTKDVEVLEGVCRLSESSVTAVRKWLYSPTLVNGEPVEVETTITVRFNFDGKN